MKRYLGTKETATAAIAVIVLVIFPLVFAGIIISIPGTDPARIFIIFWSIAASVLTFVAYVCSKNIAYALYSWGEFKEDCVRIRTVFSQKYTVEYSKCRSAGIGYYVHTIALCGAGPKVYFIYLSYDYFDESYRTRMNAWMPSQTRIRVGFSRKLYNYLLTVLPAEQAHSLRCDYEKYIKK